MSIKIPTLFQLSVHRCLTVARHRGAEVEVQAPVTVPGLPAHTVEVDFMFRRGELRTASEAKREMSGSECDAVMAYLERMAAAALAALGLE